MCRAQLEGGRRCRVHEDVGRRRSRQRAAYAVRSAEPAPATTVDGVWPNCDWREVTWRVRGCAEAVDRCQVSGGWAAVEEVLDELDQFRAAAHLRPDPISMADLNELRVWSTQLRAGVTAGLAGDREKVDRTWRVVRRRQESAGWV